MKKVKDGWHKLYGYDVYVKDGKFTRAIDKDGDFVYPYEWDWKMLCWIGIRRISLDTFRAGVRRGVMKLV